MPVFVHDGEKNIPIDSMPGVARLGWQHGLIDAVAEARSVGINQVCCWGCRCSHVLHNLQCGCSRLLCTLHCSGWAVSAAVCAAAPACRFCPIHNTACASALPPTLPCPLLHPLTLTPLYPCSTPVPPLRWSSSPRPPRS